jgi:hypothetical protein
MDQESVITLLPNQALLETWESDDELDPFLITLVCVAQWADRCAIWPLLGDFGAAGFEGELPAEAATREALLERAWSEVRAWLDHVYPGYRLIAASLWAGERELLDNHDATWASYSEIHLSPSQVEALRECWRRHGIPADLYITGPSRLDRIAAFKAEHGSSAERDDGSAAR